MSLAFDVCLLFVSFPKNKKSVIINKKRKLRQSTNFVFRSFLELAGVKLKAEEISTAVETIFRETGIENKQSITLEDFQYVMLKEHRDSFAKAQLSLPGKLSQLEVRE